MKLASHKGSSPAQRRARGIIGVVALALSACGGGGGATASPGGASAGASGSAGAAGSGAVLSLIGPSVKAIDVTGQTASSSAVVLNPVTFSVAAPPGNYYYQLSFNGTAVANVVFGGSTSTQFNTANPTAASSDFLGYPIGATLSGTWSGNTLQITELDLVAPATIGAGVYHDQLTLRLCADAACTRQATGSPLTIPVTYTVSGNPVPAAQLTVYPNAEVEAPSTQTTAASGSIIVEAGSLPPTGAYVTGGASTAGFVTDTSFTAPLAANAVSEAKGSLEFSVLPPSSAGVGIHTDSFPIHVCFNPSCGIEAQGSPWTANVTYIVDPVAGQDFTEHSLDLTVGGLVWDGQDGELYALSAPYSPLDPNSLVAIDPGTGTILNTVTLNGGVGQLQPGTLAISSDDQYLYVAISDASGVTDQIERLSTSSLAADLTISLPAYTLVNSLAPAPGAPDTLAVLSANNSPQLMIYDNATPRSEMLTGQNGQNLLAFTWGADATTLYADLGGTSDSVAEVSAGASGPTIMRTYTSPALSQTPIVTAGNGMHFVNGQVVWNSGAVFDPGSFALAPSFPVDASTLQSAAFDSTLNRAYFVSTDQPPNGTTQMTSIEGFDLTAHTPLWFARFAAQNPATYLTRWGSDGLAFSDNAGGTDSLVLISGSFIAQ